MNQERCQKNQRLNKKGFSLVELMTVVAIIGGLAALGVPQYRKFQRKARRAEANMVLGVTANSLAAYQAEYNAVTNSLGALGVEVARNPLFYVFGWPTETCGNGTFNLSVNGNAVVEAAATPAGFGQPAWNTAQVPPHLNGGAAAAATRIANVLPAAYSNNANGFGAMTTGCRQGALPGDAGMTARATASGNIGGSRTDQVQISHPDRQITIEQDGT